jgi:hypothetical protein
MVEFKGNASKYDDEKYPYLNIRQGRSGSETDIRLTTTLTEEQTTNSSCQSYFFFVIAYCCNMQGGTN